ncbi:hypothetical protein [uncultured Chitinophaga sp.]|uniref:hypothetical protein n=1 Tax=uncultured Chitinophaga sp. TaxID=339340 RepID=UPI0025DFE4C9|nr:hypothetical protein [uncultured Chitinophaga sp.]
MKKRQFTPPGRLSANHPMMVEPSKSFTGHLKPPKVTSLLQQQAVANMTRANTWAKKVTADNRLTMMYTMLAGDQRSIYHLALSDYFKAPCIGGVQTGGYKGRVGDTLIISATDNVFVDRVCVQIFTADSVFVEEGCAYQEIPDSHAWIYTATEDVINASAFHLQVCAFDLPGNRSNIWMDVVNLST